MHIAYSSLRETGKKSRTKEPTLAKNREDLKYIGYVAACKKYRNEIIAIQQYLPNWEPIFR